MTFTVHVQVRVGNDKGESKWKTMEVGHPVGALKNPSGKLQSVIDQHALGCPQFWMYLCDVSVYKTVDVRVVAVSLTSMREGKGQNHAHY